ncbi:hypothetical protein [Bacillus horti]|uniref:Uncharacterized protein n=1 Tax=Caldalkalibacillus horti TaxID=77523 RepID=A0ABT9W609_9BACI|nr:hypothetical protein [Bacillus horti]MDQ0168499.1 hypothetical protein [Bacillus horti]
MQVWLKVLLVAVLVFSASSFVWFLLGSTAYFQREMDIIGTGILVSLGFPAVLIISVFTLN